MSRIARRDVLYDGCYAHIMSRSIREMRLFKDKEDFDVLRKLFFLTKKTSGYRIFHYCFMHTHFHLAVSLPDLNAFSKAIQHVKSQYSHYYHTKYRLSGPIWRERFRALLIEDENYLRDCGEYIENNPVRAGLVKDTKNWEFSSFRHYNNCESDSLVDLYEVDHPKNQIELEFEAKEFFEQGKVIGSAFFRFQFYEKMKRN